MKIFLFSALSFLSYLLLLSASLPLSLIFPLGSLKIQSLNSSILASALVSLHLLSSQYILFLS